MSNYTIIRLAYWPIFFIMFVSGTCLGSIIGLTFALMNPATVGLFGGTFIALLAGLASGFLSIIYTGVFNILAPAIGGIRLDIKEVPGPSEDTMDTPSPESPAH